MAKETAYGRSAREDGLASQTVATECYKRILLETAAYKRRVRKLTKEMIMATMKEQMKAIEADLDEALAEADQAGEPDAEDQATLDRIAAKSQQLADRVGGPSTGGGTEQPTGENPTGENPTV